MTAAASGMSAVTTRSPGSTSCTIRGSATSEPCDTRTVRMKSDGGTRSALLATSVVRTCTGSAARYRISLMTWGHASASTQIRTRFHPGPRGDESERPGPRGGPGRRLMRGLCSGLPNVGGLEPLRALGHLEFDLVTLGQALEALALDGVEVHEHVLASLLGDEAVALRVVEPLDRTLCPRHYLSCEACASVKPHHHGGGGLLKWRRNKNAAGPGVRAAFDLDSRDSVFATNRQPREPTT